MTKRWKRESKRWKREFGEMWGAPVPLHMTKERAQLLGLIDQRGLRNAGKVLEKDRPAIIKHLGELMDCNLSLSQLKWAVSRMGVEIDGAEDCMSKDEKSAKVISLCDRYPGTIERHAASPTSGALHRNSSMHSTAASTNPVPSNIERPTGNGYAYDPDDDNDAVIVHPQTALYPEKKVTTGPGYTVTHYGNGSHHQTTQEYDQKRMRKLPYRPAPYTFERWADRASFKRTIIVGDIHGCADELLSVLDYVQFKPDTDLLVSCGDIVDRGPKISESFEILREYKALVCLGNHEEPFLKWLMFETYPEYREKWSGKNNPINLYIRADQADSMRQLKTRDWVDMLRMQLFIKLDWLHYNPLVVHAGLFPAAGKHINKPVEDMDPFSIIRMINLDSTYDTVPFYGTTGTPWWDVYDKKPGPHHVIYGHSTVKEFARIRKYSTGLDGGACYGGAMTALVIDGEDEHGKKGTRWNLYSAPAKHVHYTSSAHEISGGQGFAFGKVK